MTTASESAAVKKLTTPLQYLKGVGPIRAELLERLGLRTIADLLFHFPRGYLDFSDERPVDQLEEGKLQSVRGVVEDIEFRHISRGGCILGLSVRCRGGQLRALWFNQPYMQEKFAIGQRLLLSGKPKRRGLIWEMAHPRADSLDAEEEEPSLKILPLYPLTEGLQQWEMRKLVRTAIEGYADYLEEVFPEDYLQAHHLWPLRRAVDQIHFPENKDRLEHARRRFIYQELFILQLALAVRRRRQWERPQAPRLEATAKIDARIRRLFPFELTAGQEQAIAEIAADMARPIPMNRLLHGEVGSGKTVAAVYAMLLAVAYGYQAVLMAPTEVLVRQHANTLERLLAKSRVRRAVLFGGLPPARRELLLRMIAAGEVDIVVGTQAVIQEDVSFAKLGLVVIDEQHKFGVRQRAILKQAGTEPHYLVMTATPIPRTLALTLFGDLDVSTIRDVPPGRQKVHTYLADEEQRSKWWDFFRRKLREGRQGYVVVPYIEESADADMLSLEEIFEALANGELEAFHLGLLHGRMSSAEKDAVMEQFREGKIQVLVCTSVVEVGVDVPNATLMTIEGGHRFGLAQLHQLRGRVSRGKAAGYCCVFADTRNEDARQRLQAFAATTDGFELAELDFQLRGPGEIFGARQHGLPPLKIAELPRDQAVLEEARGDAQTLVAADPGLALPQHAGLRRQMLARYGRALDLGDVG